MKRNISLVIALLVMGIIYFYYHFKGAEFKNDIMENPIIANCQIKKVTFINKRGYRIEYEYIINGKIYNSDSYRSIFPLNNVAIGKFFPFIYNKEKPEKHEILITPDNFQEFGIEFPDSLDWVLPYFK